MSAVMFATSHDEVTRCTEAIALAILVEEDVDLIGARATRVRLHNAMAVDDCDSVFFMAHGDKNSIYQDDHTPALTIEDCPIVHDKHVYAWACHTATTLGHRASFAGGTWWGYDCAVTAIDPQDDGQAIVVSIFAFIKNNFAASSRRREFTPFLLRLEELCVDGQRQLDVVFEQYDGEIFSLYSCCNQIWSRLRIWSDANDQPVIHPQSPPPYIEI